MTGSIDSEKWQMAASRLISQALSKAKASGGWISWAGRPFAVPHSLSAANIYCLMESALAWLPCSLCNQKQHRPPDR